MADRGLALVLGSNGQDGTFLVRHLSRTGWRVVGVGRESGSTYREPISGFEYQSLDLRDPVALADLVKGIAPDRVFHVAAVHASAAANQYETQFADMLDVNVKSVHTVLEHFRRRADGPRLFYASSSKVFGDPLPSRVSSESRRSSACLYSLSKNAATELIDYYRRTHGVVASVGFLFNHESELRPPEFFIPKLARALSGARLGRRETTEFFTLDFWCDWGSADEYMSIVIDLLEAAPGRDVAVASGRCVHARALAKDLFAEVDLDLADYIVERERARAGQGRYEVDLAPLESLVRRKPQVSVQTILRRLVEREMAEAAGRV